MELSSDEEEEYLINPDINHGGYRQTGDQVEDTSPMDTTSSIPIPLNLIGDQPAQPQTEPEDTVQKETFNNVGDEP